MKIIYFVVAIIFGLASWICTETTWEYAYIVEYICLFIASLYVVLVFIYQEENENSKKYTIATPCNLIYVIIIAVLLFLLRDYKLKDYKTVQQSFQKLVVIVNACQALVLILYYKLRDIYVHM